MNKPTFDRARPLSWSAISSFEYDPEQWYRKYVLGQTDPASKEMLFGSEIGNKLASDPTFMTCVPRLSLFEFELNAKFGKIPLIGYIDSYELHTDLLEFKTGKKPWTQKRADDHGQLDMYLLMLHLTYNVKPHDVQCSIVWMPTQETGDFQISLIDPNKVHIFPTKRSMSDILRFGMRINETYKKMDEYCQNKVIPTIIKN